MCTLALKGRPFPLVLFAATLICCSSGALQGASYTWTYDGNGVWEDPNNWNPKGYPNAVGDIANFTNFTGGTRTVSLMGKTVEALYLGTPGGSANYVLRNVWLDMNANGPQASIIAQGGDHSILTSLYAWDNLLVSGDGNVYIDYLYRSNRELTKEGAGVLTLRSRSGSGGPTMVNAGTLKLAGNDALPSAYTVTVSGALLDLNGYNQTLSDLRLTAGTVQTGGGTLNLQDANVSVAPANTAATIGGKVHLGGSGSCFLVADGNAPIDLQVDATIGGQTLLKTGPGSMLLGSANTYSGTVVAGGVLKMGGAAALPPGSTVTVAGGLLDLDGYDQTVWGLTMIGGKVRTGAGTLKIQGAVRAELASESPVIEGQVWFDANNVLTMDLGGKTPGSEYDQLVITGTGILGGTLEVVLINAFVPALGDSFLLLDGGTLTGTFAGVTLPTLGGGLYWQIEQTSSDYSLHVMPEPGTIALVGLGCLAMLRRRR